MNATKKYLLDGAAIEKKLQRLALEVIENNLEEKEIIFVGIEQNGKVLAKNIQQRVQQGSSIQTELITLKLDKKKPGKITLSQQLAFDHKTIILVDDVTNSGKTLLYALKPFLEYHPSKIQILVLVERTHTLFPVSADYKGVALATTFQNHIFVEVDGDRITGAYLN